MAKMYPPEGHCGLNTLKPDKDGAYNVPEHQVVEFEKVHGFRRAIDGRPPTPDQAEATVEEHRRQLSAYAERIKILEAEVNTLTTANARITRERDNLAAQVRARQK